MAGRKNPTGIFCFNHLGNWSGGLVSILNPFAPMPKRRPSGAKYSFVLGGRVMRRHNQGHMPSAGERPNG